MSRITDTHSEIWAKDSPKGDPSKIVVYIEEQNARSHDRSVHSMLYVER